MSWSDLDWLRAEALAQDQARRNTSGPTAVGTRGLITGRRVKLTDKLTVSTPGVPAVATIEFPATVQGEVYQSARELAADYDMPLAVLSARLAHGWPLLEALTAPTRAGVQRP